MNSEPNLFSNSNITSDKITSITGLWAFSEAALGGILHVLRIPFTGLFVGGAAVIFISLLYFYSRKTSTILKSTLIVILIKFIISPYTPINAYFSVFVEAIFGVIIFSLVKNYHISAFILGITSLIFSALQKLIVLTVLFGNTLWESIDIFSNYIIGLFLVRDDVSIGVSYILIGLYLLSHIFGGITAGIIAGRVPKWVGNFSGEIDHDKIILINDSKKQKEKRKRRFWLQKKSGIVLIVISLILIVLSYFFNEFESNLAFKILIMFIRSVVITVVWFLLIAPIVMTYLKKYFAKKRGAYSDEVNDLIESLPQMKAIVYYSWKQSEEGKGLGRLKLFFSYLFSILLRD